MFHQAESPIIPHLLGSVLLIVLLFAGAFFLLRYYLEKSRKQVVQSVAQPNRDIILPLRLQAYERLVLFLERIHPSNLVMRFSSPELTARQLQTLMVRAIREEFEYNLSQQLYISAELWDRVKNAKEETIASINHSLGALPDDAMSADLVKSVFATTVSQSPHPVESVLEGIRNEMQRLFS